MSLFGNSSLQLSVLLVSHLRPLANQLLQVLPRPGEYSVQTYKWIMLWENTSWKTITICYFYDIVKFEFVNLKQSA